MSYESEFWKTVETPKRKKDYEGRYIKLLVDSPNVRIYERHQPSLLKAGSIVLLEARVNQKQAVLSSYPCNTNLLPDPKDRVLKVQWQCPYCQKYHYEGLPETWIAEGKLVFVEKQTHEAV